MNKNPKYYIIAFLVILNFCGSGFYIQYNNKNIKYLNGEILRMNDEIEKNQLQLKLQNKVNVIQKQLNEEIIHRVIR